ncbi:hypothetical protein B0T09DRAFT_371286 [Sordaria sp. MPI-SDFR-AT-0083]|nr:hypothetical protein B0T09DRAFT_371286 [Sordaria sp. MPI-SDFR-AT-0083]
MANNIIPPGSLLSQALGEVHGQQRGFSVSPLEFLPRLRMIRKLANRSTLVGISCVWIFADGAACHHKLLCVQHPPQSDRKPLATLTSASIATHVGNLECNNFNSFMTRKSQTPEGKQQDPHPCSILSDSDGKLTAFVFQALAPPFLPARKSRTVTLARLALLVLQPTKARGAPSYFEASRRPFFQQTQTSTGQPWMATLPFCKRREAQDDPARHSSTLLDRKDSFTAPQRF